MFWFPQTNEFWQSHNSPFAVNSRLHDYLVAKSFFFWRVEDPTFPQPSHIQVRGIPGGVMAAWVLGCYGWIYPRCLSLRMNGANGFMNKASSTVTILKQTQTNTALRKKLSAISGDQRASPLWKQDLSLTLP